MRRGLALARSYATERKAFGQPLEQLPLHADTLAGLEAETWGAFLMTFLLVELNGRLERNEIDDQQRALLRLLTPLTKLITGKQAVAVVTEVIESFGGAGYCRGHRPAAAAARHARAAHLGGHDQRAVARCTAAQRPALRAGGADGHARRPACAPCRSRAWWLRRSRRSARSSARRWCSRAGRSRKCCRPARGGSRMTLARALQLTLLCEHAQWMIDHGGDRRGYAAAMRFARQPVDLMTEVDPATARPPAARLTAARRASASDARRPRSAHERARRGQRRKAVPSR